MEVHYVEAENTVRVRIDIGDKPMEFPELDKIKRALTDAYTGTDITTDLVLHDHGQVGTAVG